MLPGNRRAMRGASQIRATILLEIAHGLLGKRIQPPGFDITLELLIPRLSIETVKPFPKRRKLLAGKLADCRFDFRNRAHDGKS